MPLTVLSVAYPLAKVSPGTAGGAEQVLLAIDHGLVRHGDRSLVLAAAGSQCAGLLLPVPIPHSELDERTKVESRARFKGAIEGALRDYRIDVIHMHGLDFQEYLPSCDIPIVVTLHLPLAWYSAEALQQGRDDVYFVCVSRAQAATAPSGARIDEIIPNGIEVQKFLLSSLKSDYALVLGRICPEKGVHLALEAARRARVRVILAGSVFEYPEHRAYFEECVRPRLGSDSHFIGPVGGDRKASLLSGAKCLLIPSKAPETSSLIAMEAFASGTPVVAWRSGALLEIVADGRTGWLVSSVDEMAAAMRKLDAIDPAECRRQAARRFCSDRMISEYLSLYHRVARQSRTTEQLVA